MNLKAISLLFLLTFWVQNIVVAQQEWKFKKETKGIKVYTKSVEGSNIKQLKFTLTIEASMSAIVALLIDVEAYQRWVFKCTESKNLKREGHNTYDYYLIDFPWPLNDRELYSYATLEQDPTTKIVTIVNVGVPDFAPPKEGLIRVVNHENRWIFKPVGPNKVEGTYFLRSEPAGNIPTWMVNLAIDQGPVKTMKKFRKILKEDIYKNADLDFIKEFGED